jgi:hypothetical protein
MRTTFIVIAVITLLLGGCATIPPDSTAVDYPGTPAFPGAMGFGIGTVGGRGGAVIYVTSLDDAGPGTLRAAVETSGPRTVVFAVSGTIELQRELIIRQDNLTIAGQTAPGDGICLRGFPLIVSANEVIIRFIRVRPGDELRREFDSISLEEGGNIVIDHCSASWSIDETLSVSQRRDSSRDLLTNVTVQWCIISESLNDSYHSKGEHGYGSLIRGHDGSLYSFHHNLWVHHRARMPRPGNYESADRDPDGALIDFRNNVFYDWGGGSSGYNADTDSISRYNFINNYYLRGPSSTGARIFDESCSLAQAYFAGNYLDGRLPRDPWLPVTGTTGGDYRLSEPLEAGYVATENAEVAFERVLRFAGASLSRDSVDERMIRDVTGRTGTVIDSQDEVGGWPILMSTTARPDRDRDGMPDEWETARGLDPASPADGAVDVDGNGFTELEDYYNGLVVGLY